MDSMIGKYKSASGLGKLFVWLSVAVVIATIGSYIREVRMALAMDPASYNCTSDSMMKQLCQHPYDATITWAVLGVVIFCWPLLLAWLMVGTMYVARRSSTKPLAHSDEPKSQSPGSLR